MLGKQEVEILQHMKKKMKGSSNFIEYVGIVLLIRFLCQNPDIYLFK